MNPRLMLLTAFGLGLVRPGPGTWGSLFAILVTGLTLVFSTDALVVNGVLIGLVIVFSAACLVFGAWAEKHFGGKDAQQIVADEVAGQALALLFITWRPMETGAGDAWLWNLGWLFAGFVLFRIFDITKLPPIGTVQSLPRGWGVLLDDLLAGLVACGLIQVSMRLFF